LRAPVRNYGRSPLFAIHSAAAVELFRPENASAITGILRGQRGRLSHKTGDEVMARQSITPYRSGALSSDPFISLRGMSQLVDEMFRSTMPMIAGEGDGGMLMPQINVAETENEYRITADLPGVEEVDVTLDGDLLTIRGEKRAERERDRANYHLVERSYGEFVRTIRIPHSVRPDQVVAKVENGVLTVTLPKDQSQGQARRIEVQGSAQRGAQGTPEGSAQRTSEESAPAGSPSGGPASTH
jgi:HSP20 family protein